VLIPYHTALLAWEGNTCRVKVRQTPSQIQSHRIAPKWDRMRIEREALGLGEQQGGQSADPSREYLLLMSPYRAIGIFGGIGLLRRYVEAGKQADRLIEVKVINQLLRLGLLRLRVGPGLRGGEELWRGVAAELVAEDAERAGPLS
jgi:hypothetical protein